MEVKQRFVPQVAIDFATKLVIHDLDDLGYPHFLGHLHI